MILKGRTEIYGSSRPRPSAVAKVCGLTDYGDDIALKMPGGMAYLAVTLAAEPHARILSIDTSEAEKMPGVIKVMTATGCQGQQQHRHASRYPPLEGHRNTSLPGHRWGQGLPQGRCGGTGRRRHRGSRPGRCGGSQAGAGDPAPPTSHSPRPVMPNAIQMHETCPNSYLEAPSAQGRGSRRRCLTRQHMWWRAASTPSVSPICPSSPMYARATMTLMATLWFSARRRL